MTRVDPVLARLGPKLCRDCRYVRPDRSWIWLFSKYRWVFAKCARRSPQRAYEANAETLVTGLPSLQGPDFHYASTERLDLNIQDHCGRSAKFFEARV